MIEAKVLKIGKDSFTINSLPATRALVIGAKLAKIVGGVGKGVSDLTLNPKEFAEAFHIGNMLQGVLQNIDADGAPELIRDIVRESLVVPQFEGEIDNIGPEQRFQEWYDNRFSKELNDLAVLLYEIFYHNYGDPVAYVKKIIARAGENGWLAPSVLSSEETNSGQEQAS